MRPTEFQKSVNSPENATTAALHFLTVKPTWCSNINSQRQTHLLNGMSILSPAVKSHTRCCRPTYCLELDTEYKSWYYIACFLRQQQEMP